MVLKVEVAVIVEAVVTVVGTVTVDVAHPVRSTKIPNEQRISFPFIKSSSLSLYKECQIYLSELVF